jgi:hypothetical protein
MATRSTIALEYADGTVEQIYCHWDGYLENNGVILETHYMDPFKVKELLALGDISSLCATVEETKEGAYHFSRGEDFVVRKYKDLIDYFEECQQEEYDYILRNINGKATWFVRCYATEVRWVEFGEAKGLIEKMNKESAY